MECGRNHFYPPFFVAGIYTINPAIKQVYSVMPDLIRHPVPTWIPAFAGMTTLMYLVAGVIIDTNGAVWWKREGGMRKGEVGNGSAGRLYWLELLDESGLMNSILMKELIKESDELVAVFVTIGKKSKE